ncbi:parathymosin [Paroedura picta]|uniref:parathymosin n=1 Tax=Paroedura picta TaxID=143630 RepID=UPI004055BA6F
MPIGTPPEKPSRPNACFGATKKGVDGMAHVPFKCCRRGSCAVVALPRSSGSSSTGRGGREGGRACLACPCVGGESEQRKGDKDESARPPEPLPCLPGGAEWAWVPGGARHRPGRPVRPEGFPWRRAAAPALRGPSVPLPPPPLRRAALPLSRSALPPSFPASLPPRGSLPLPFLPSLPPCLPACLPRHRREPSINPPFWHSPTVGEEAPVLVAPESRRATAVAARRASRPVPSRPASAPRSLSRPPARSPPLSPLVSRRRRGMSEKSAEEAPVELGAKDLKEKKEKHEEKSARKEKKEIIEDDENGAEEEEDDEDANPEDVDDEDEDDEDDENDQEPDSHAVKRSAEKKQEEDEVDPKRKKTENGSSA